MSKVPFLRTPYNYDTNAVSDDAALRCLDESLAVQSEKDDADINVIVRRFGITGELPNDIAMPQSGDFTGITDFHTAMNVVRQAEEEFMRVPAEIRKRFGNDPHEMMAFLADEGNRDEARRLGLLAPVVEAPPPAVLDVRVVSGDLPPKN